MVARIVIASADDQRRVRPERSVPAGESHRQRGADALRNQQQAGVTASSPRTIWK